jgi:hypothetical protein
VKRAGLTGRRVTWLTLRRTAASLMFDAGLTLFEVQQRLGHRSPTLTAQVYTHLMRERFEEGREKLEEYMQANRFRTTPDADQSAAVFPGSLMWGGRRTTRVCGPDPANHARRPERRCDRARAVAGIRCA